MWGSTFPHSFASRVIRKPRRATLLTIAYLVTALAGDGTGDPNEEEDKRQHEAHHLVESAIHLAQADDKPRRCDRTAVATALALCGATRTTRTRARDKICTLSHAARACLIRTTARAKGTNSLCTNIQHSFKRCFRLKSFGKLCRTYIFGVVSKKNCMWNCGQSHYTASEPSHSNNTMGRRTLTLFESFCPLNL